jgi:hypothetical protein
MKSVYQVGKVAGQKRKEEQDWRYSQVRGSDRLPLLARLPSNE